MQKATSSYRTYSIPSKTAALVPEFAVEDLPSEELQPRFLRLQWRTCPWAEHFHYKWWNYFCQLHMKNTYVYVWDILYLTSIKYWYSKYLNINSETTHKRKKYNRLSTGTGNTEIILVFLLHTGYTEICNYRLEKKWMKYAIEERYFSGYLFNLQSCLWWL